MKSPFYPIEVHDLTVSYQRKPVLYGVDLEIEEGSLVGVIGPNGAGKSTLIKNHHEYGFAKWRVCENFR